MARPMQTQREEMFISSYVQEIDAPPMSDNIVDKILELVTNSAFGTFKEMDIDRKNKWKVIDYVALSKHLKSKEETSVVLKSTNPIGMSCSITKSEYYNTINFNLVPDHFKQNKYEDLFDLMYRNARIFEKYSRGNASADLFEINDFYVNNNLPYLPDIFSSYVSWFTLLSPLLYEKHFKRTDLLAAPAFKIYEYEDGWIGIRAYDDPFNFTSQEVADQIVKLTNYLNDHRTDK